MGTAVGAVVVTAAAAGLLKGALMLGRAVAAWEESGLANRSSVMPTTQTATSHTARAMVTDLGSLLSVRQLIRLITGQNRADHIDSARSSARRR